MFALEALSLAGESYTNSASVRKACPFLVDRRMKDGGWGETYLVSQYHDRVLSLYADCGSRVSLA
jgi:squalene cyclase